MCLETLITMAMQLGLNSVLPEGVMGVDRNDGVRWESFKSEGLKEAERQAKGETERDG